MELARLREACAALPLFPLPGTALMPGSLLPLHVFEPRYRQLVTDCLRDGGPLSVPQLRADAVDALGRPAYYGYASVGTIGAHQELDDGRFNVLVQPLARIRIVDEAASTRLYRVARAEVLTDIPHTPRHLERVGERVRALFRPLVGRMGELGDGVARALQALPAERVPEALAGIVLRQDHARQAWLADDDPVTRASRVEEAVLTLLAEVATSTPAEA